jgi:hypothetical protein
VKTISLKKVSAVAVASLGFGLLSVVPAQATAGDITNIVTAGSGSTTAGVQEVAVGTEATNVMSMTVVTGNAAAAVATVTATQTARPNGAAAATGSATSASNAMTLVANGTLTAGTTVSAANATPSAVVTLGGTSGQTAAATLIFKFTPATPGIYTFTLTTTAMQTNAVSANTPTITINATVAAGNSAFVGTTAANIGSQGPSGTTITTASSIKATTGGIAQLIFQSAASDVKYSIGSTGVGTVTSLVQPSTFFATAATAVGADAGTSFVFNNLTNAGAGAVWTPTTLGKSFAAIQIQSAVAGTTSVTVTPISAAGVPSVARTATIVWGANATTSVGASILRQAGPTVAQDDQGLTTPNALYSTTVDATPILVSKTAGTNASQILVMLLNNDGTAAANGDVVTATVSGSGLVLANQSATAAAGTVRASSTILTAGNNVAYVHVTSDGSAGTGTVSISVTSALTGVTTVLGSKTQTYVGSVSAIAVASTNFNIGAAGKTTGSATATRNPAIELGAAVANDAAVDTMPAFVIKTTDGTNPAAISGAGVPTVSSADTTVVSTGTCIADTTTAANRLLTGQGGSVGFYNCNFVGGANAVSGKSVVLTFKTPSTTAGVDLTTTATVTIGSTTVASEKISTDATTYVAGQQMVVTITAKDSSGNPVADGTASPAVTANKALGTSATALAAGFYAGGVAANAASVAKSSLFAPSLAGAFTLTATGKDAAATKLTASASVTDANAGLLTQIDALNAKIVALNALIAKIMKKLGVK